MFTFLTIDQSSDICGFAIFRNAKLYNYGSFKLSDKNSEKTPEAHAERRQYLMETLKNINSKYKINHIIYEDVYAKKNVRTAMLLSKVQAAIESFCYMNNITFEEFGAKEWRSYLPLKSKSSKREDIKKSIHDYINKTYPELKEEIEDTKEAICIGLAWIKKQNKLLDKQISS